MKIIQLAVNNTGMVGLSEDGQVWSHKAISAYEGLWVHMDIKGFVKSDLSDFKNPKYIPLQPNKLNLTKE
jgi:hypothetical protein